MENRLWNISLLPDMQSESLIRELFIFTFYQQQHGSLFIKAASLLFRIARALCLVEGMSRGSLARSVDRFLYNFIPTSYAEMTRFPLINSQAIILFGHALRNSKPGREFQTSRVLLGNDAHIRLRVPSLPFIYYLWRKLKLIPFPFRKIPVEKLKISYGI